jgi:hypothetical protein
MSGNTVETGFEFKYAVVDLTDNSTAVSTRRSMVRGVYVNTTVSAATIVKNGTTSVFTLPASTFPGQFIAFGDVVFDGGIVIDPDDSATGSITVVYKPVL